MSKIQSGQDTLVTALDRACEELAAMSEHIGRLQHTIPDAISEMSLDLYRELQALDYVHQHLDELRVYINAVAAMSDKNWSVDITNATTELRLAMMVARLRGVAQAANSQHQDAGELELLCSRSR